VETQLGAVLSNLRRGSGTSFHRQATRDGGDPLTVRCGGDCGSTSPVKCGKENEIEDLEFPGGGAYCSPAWSKLEEDEGATPASAYVVTKTGGEEPRGQADKHLAQASGPPVQ
jgi:hypothetical protein